MAETGLDKKALKKTNSFRGGGGGGDETNLPGTPTTGAKNKKHNDVVEKFQVRAPRRMSMAGADDAEAKKLAEEARKKKRPKKSQSLMRRSSFSSAKRTLRATAKSMFQYRRESFNENKQDGDDPSWEVDALKDGSDLTDYDEFYIDPRSSFRRTWDLWIILLVIYSAVAIPYYSAFSKREKDWKVGLDYTFDCLFILDIMFNFFTAYYDKFGRLVASRAKIKSNYLRTWFIIDVLASFPFELFASIGSSGIDRNSDIFSLFKFPRLLRLGRILKFIERLGVYANIWRILRLLGIIILVLHWVTCLWHLIVCGSSDLNELDHAMLAMCEKSWDSPADNAYLQASYWAVLLLLGNDVHPFNNGTTALSVMMLLVGSFLYAAVFGIVAALMNALQAKDLVFRNKIDSINDIIRYLNMPEELGERVRQYYEYLWIRYRDLDTGLDEFTKGLPSSLRDEVLLFMHSDLLRKVPLFKSVEPIVVLEVVRHMKTVLALPGDIVIRKGDPAIGVYIISRGSCEVLVSETTNQVQERDLLKKAADAAMDGDDTDDPSKLSQEAIDRIARRAAGMVEDEEDVSPGKEKSAVDALLDQQKVSRNARRRLSHSSSKVFDLTEANVTGVMGHSAAGGKFEPGDAEFVNKSAPLVSATNPVLSSGDHFGERSLITGEAVNASVMAISFCDLHLLHKEDFQDIMAMNPTLKDVLIQHRAHVFDMQKNELKHTLKAKRRKSTAFEERLGLDKIAKGPASGALDETEKDMFVNVLNSIQDRLVKMEDSIAEVKQIEQQRHEEEVQKREEEEAKMEDEAYIKSLLSH